MSDGNKLFNPLDKKNLGESVAAALLCSDIRNMPPNSFNGAGVYAIYYTGPNPLYEQLTKINCDNQFKCPIYVGKAVPAGARKGGFGFDSETGKALYARLSQHADSINAANNLDLKDFYCRYLVVDDIWIPLAESMLISKFQPVWNCALDGFGNHDPGKGRHAGMKPPWDCVHSGRLWANRLTPNSLSIEELENRIKKHLDIILQSNNFFK